MSLWWLAIALSSVVIIVGVLVVVLAWRTFVRGDLGQLHEDDGIEAQVQAELDAAVAWWQEVMGAKFQPWQLKVMAQHVRERLR